MVFCFFFLILAFRCLYIIVFFCVCSCISSGICSYNFDPSLVKRALVSSICFWVKIRIVFLCFRTSMKFEVSFLLLSENMTMVVVKELFNVFVSLTVTLAKTTVFTWHSLCYFLFVCIFHVFHLAFFFVCVCLCLCKQYFHVLAFEVLGTCSHSFECRNVLISYFLTLLMSRNKIKGWKLVLGACFFPEKKKHSDKRWVP